MLSVFFFCSNHFDYKKSRSNMLVAFAREEWFCLCVFFFCQFFFHICGMIVSIVLMPLPLPFHHNTRKTIWLILFACLWNKNDGKCVLIFIFCWLFLWFFFGNFCIQLMYDLIIVIFLSIYYLLIPSINIYWVWHWTPPARPCWSSSLS